MFTLSIATRFLTSKKSQTILIIMGFAVGISVNIFVGSLIQSLQNNLIQTTVGTQPHITISHQNQSEMIENYNPLIDKISSISGITKIATALDVRAFIMNIHPNSPDDIVLRGFNLNDANKIYDFYNSETFTGSKPTNSSQILIGKTLSENLEVSIGDKLVIKMDPNPSKPNQTLIISGIFDLGVTQINSLWVIVNQQTAENLANVSSAITSINIQVDNIFSADTIASEIKTKLQDNSLQITNWKETNAQLLSGLSAQSSSTTIIQIFVLLAVVIGIASILGITVIQKSRQIGILKAMGLNDRGSALVFLFEGLIIGSLGSLVGLGLAAGLIWSFNTFAGGSEAGLFDIIIEPQFAIQTIIIAIIASILASLIPARNSSKMEVIEIIRNN